MNLPKDKLVAIAGMLLSVILVVAGQKGCEYTDLLDVVAPPTDPVVTPDDPKTGFVAVLYESEDGELLPYAKSAIEKLRAEGYDVRASDDDITDGTGQPPPYVEPIRAVGLPGYGIVRDGKVVEAAKLPTTEEAILEAVKQ